MRRAIKFALTIGSAALIVSGAATAGPPTPYDQWSVVGGDIMNAAGTGAVPCPTGFSCGSGVVGGGFLQRTITDAAGNQYFQTIITDEGVTGSPGTLAFSDESYVRSGSSVGGIAGKQRVTDAASELSTTNELNMGWAQTVGAAAPQLDLRQSVAESASGFSSGFRFRQEGDGRIAMDLDQSVILEVGASPATSDKQVFALRQVETASSGSASIPGGGTMTWAAGETIKAIWTGQTMPSTAQVFGFQSHGNNNTGQVSSFFSLSETGPWNWNPVFGAAPTF